MGKVVFKSTANKGAASYILEVATGDFVFKEGELGTEMYIIQEGSVEILTGVEDEERMALLERGDFFGEMALLEDLPRAASARVASDARLLRINGSTFTQMLQSNPEIAVRMMRKFSRRLRQTDERLKQVLGDRSSASMPAMKPGFPETAADRTVAGKAEAVGSERLVDETGGTVLALLAGTTTTVGRRDPVTGIYPDIDLTPFDTQRSISRSHAKIFRKDGKLFMVEEIGTMNGTFRNGLRLETGEPAEIRPGDELRFGVVALRLTLEE